MVKGWWLGLNIVMNISDEGGDDDGKKEVGGVGDEDNKNYENHGYDSNWK